jgi:hypothetical protein
MSFSQLCVTINGLFASLALILKWRNANLNASKTLKYEVDSLSNFPKSSDTVVLNELLTYQTWS